MTITLTDEEQDKLYKKLGKSNELTIRYVVDTVGHQTYYHWQDKKCILKGNQKTAYVKVNNANKRAKAYVCVNGQVKRAVVWIGVNGTPKRCI